MTRTLGGPDTDAGHPTIAAGLEPGHRDTVTGLDAGRRDTVAGLDLGHRATVAGLDPGHRATVAGFDLGHRDTVAAEHWLGAAVPDDPGLVACTHLVHGARPRVVVTIAGVDLTVFPAPEASEAATAAAENHASGHGGRAVRFPGVRALTGTMPLATLLELSAIDEVRVIGGPPATPQTLIDTRDFVRPQWESGRLVLVATPAPGGRIAPFEVPNPTPCCANH